MKIIDLGIWVAGIKWTHIEDDRGSLDRIWDSSLFDDSDGFKQISLIKNLEEGTLRGLHFQIKPFEESKLISCIRGKIFDVLVNIDPDSLNFGQKVCVEISPTGNINALKVPKGFAHGYLTLEKDSHILYLTDNVFSSDHAKGISWNDPQLNIPWPRQINRISLRDSQMPNWKEYFEKL